MSLACVLLRHDVRARWIGDLRAAYCATCDCIYVPNRHDAPQGRAAGTFPSAGRASLRAVPAAPVGVRPG